MQNNIQEKIAKAYCWKNFTTAVISSGLINATYKYETEKENFIVQQINTSVFKNPTAINENIQLISNYLQETKQEKLFPSLIEHSTGNTLLQIENNYYRAFEFIENSITTPVVNNAQQAYEAAKQFGKFTFLLKNFDAKTLNTTLPNFHNLSLRYQEFENALSNGNATRIKENKTLINAIQKQQFIVQRFENFIQESSVKIRVTHHDTKISNVLFNKNNQAIFVIDLDTIMPGYFLSDVGDMIRTYISPVSEEEKDFSTIIIREEVLKAIQEGYLYYMKNELSSFEKENFFFSGEVLIYMQAIRFLTDYFNNDIYYQTTYPHQNKIRAANQINLLEKLQYTLSKENFSN